MQKKLFFYTIFTVFFFITSCHKDVIFLNPYLIEIQDTVLQKQLASEKDYDKKINKIKQFINCHFYMINPVHIEYIYGSCIAGFYVYLYDNIVPSIRNLPWVGDIEYIEEEKDNIIIEDNIKNIKNVKNIQYIEKNFLQKKIGYQNYDGRNVAWIIDTGIDLNHTALTVDKVRSRNFIGSGSAQDMHGHGTHVAGIIGGKPTENFQGGVAQGATVVAIKTMNNQGKTSFGCILKGIDYVHAVAAPYDVVNMSIGARKSSRLFRKAVVSTAKKNIFVVIAAGNDGQNIDKKKCLSSIFNEQNIYIVSSIEESYNTTNSKFRYSASSNYVDTKEINNVYVAPGNNIFSTWKNNKYFEANGTSMAAPHVAGVLLHKKKKFKKWKVPFVALYSNSMYMPVLNN